jgi:hypothetical protein
MKRLSEYSLVSRADDDDYQVEAGRMAAGCAGPVDGIVVDASASEDSDEEIDESLVTMRRNRPRTIAAVAAFTVLFAVALVAAIQTLGLAARRGEGTVAPPALPASGSDTSSPAVVPHYTWDGKKCFVDNAELREAVDAYLLNKTNETLEAVYGLPIGSWCVRYVESFSLVFASDGRNFTYPDRTEEIRLLMSRFNDDITGWDVTGAKDLDRTFRASRYFNQDLSGWDVSRVESMIGTFEMTNRFDGGTWQPALLRRGAV